MKNRSSIVSVVALLSAISFAVPAYAQEAGAQAGGSTSTQTDTSTQAGGAGGSTTTDTQAGGTAQGGATVDQGGAQAGGGMNVDVSTEQQTEIRSAITEVNVQPVSNIDIDINIGVAVPQTIHLEPLPAKVIAILPQFKGYLFFLLADGRIVIVAPDTLKIVYILAA